jgi:hypothetical protein
MNRKDLKVGSTYSAKVAGKRTTVRLDRIRSEEVPIRYDVTDLTTEKEHTFESAARFTRIDPANKRVVKVPAKKRGKQKVTAKAATKHMNETLPSYTPAPIKEEEAAVIRADGVVAVANKPTLVEHKTSKLGQQIAKERKKEATGNGFAPHLIVEALAGTGKTTTLIEGLKQVLGYPSNLKPSPQQAAVWEAMKQGPRPSSTCFVAFNRSIANELKSRVPPGSQAMTMHGMGFRAISRNFRLKKGDDAVNEYRTSNILEELTGINIRQLRVQKPMVVSAVASLVSLCKMNLVGFGVPQPTDFEYNQQVIAAGYGSDNPPPSSWQPQKQMIFGLDWQEPLLSLAAHYDVDLNHSEGEIISLVPRVLERALDVQRDMYIDYDDMIWLCVVLNVPMFKFDMLMWDESQDGNKCQQELAFMAGHRLVLCGDRHQAIYGFAGADSEALINMEKRLGESPRGVKILPLTVTRRCGKAIVAEAQKIVPEFEAFETNPPGAIIHAAYNEPKSRGSVNQLPAGGRPATDDSENRQRPGDDNRDQRTTVSEGCEGTGKNSGDVER